VRRADDGGPATPGEGVADLVERRAGVAVEEGDLDAQRLVLGAAGAGEHRRHDPAALLGADCVARQQRLKLGPGERADVDPRAGLVVDAEGHVVGARRAAAILPQRFGLSVHDAAALRSDAASLGVAKPLQGAILVEAVKHALDPTSQSRIVRYHVCRQQRQVASERSHDPTARSNRPNFVSWP
jgi:hypothetical protein